MAIQLRYKGEVVYRGCDAKTFLMVEPNSTVEVSKEKANQLLQDFPDVWIYDEETVYKDAIETVNKNSMNRGRPKKG
ncbi:MAG: hypothetical protein KJ621_21150 [Proteobacteria bacterium]|nr:hypothetical protein [Pseudomonadota bacterium]